MSLNDTSNKLYSIFSAMAKRIDPSGAMKGCLSQADANNALLDIENEQPNLFKDLPDDIKAKLKPGTGLSSDLFNLMDPLGVADGKINQEEFTKGLEQGTKEDDANVNLGNHKREKGAVDDCMIHGVYTVKNADGKYNSDLTAQNVIGDFENLLQGTPGSIVNGNVNKGELQTVIAKYTAAGQTDRAKTAEYILDGYDWFKNKNGDVDVASLAAGLKNPWVNGEAPAQWE